MDHGSLTDNNGKKTDFRNVILIMTSNIGARDLQRTRQVSRVLRTRAVVMMIPLTTPLSPEFRIGLTHEFASLRSSPRSCSIAEKFIRN